MRNEKERSRGGWRGWRVITARGVVLLMLSLTAASASCAQSAVVRVNQAGYVSGASKRAYLMSTGSQAGATFSVVNSASSSVFSAAIGASLGKWGSYTVYALDFNAVSAADTYTISVTGPMPATSPKFKIDTATNLYSTPLANALSYFQNSRDGANFIASPLRTAAGHLNDQSAKVYFTPTVDASGSFVGDLTPTGAVIDASGGWWDAGGDYLKFVETASYTTALLLAGVRDFPNQMGAASSTSNFTAETKFDLDWLQKMWSDSNQTLYYQVGIGAGNATTTSDHDIWRFAQDDDSWQGCSFNDRYICHRPVFINTAGGSGAKISPNLAGRLAADFAECYQVFKASKPAYANQCLLSAEHVFELADTAPTGNLLTTIPFRFYGEGEWRDDMELGATELYFALAGGNLPSGLPQTDPLFYLQKAAMWANAYITGPNDAADTLNLYDVSGLAHFELYRAIGQAGNPTGLAVSQATLLADLKKQLDHAVAQGNTEPFGFGFPWSTDDTASHGAGLSVMASEYGFLTGTATYAPRAPRWLGNILGANAWGASFIVGIGNTFPNCMQDQIANLVGSLNGTPPILAGAVVEGPNSHGSSGLPSGARTCNASSRFSPFNGHGSVFIDDVQSYSTVEPAVDLAASSPLAFAWQITTPGLTAAAGTSTTVVSSNNPSTYGGAVTFTATVNSSAAGTITGTVTFKDGSAVLGTGTVAAGKATLTTSTLGGGMHAITAVYGGDANFAGSTSTALSQKVKKAATSCAVVSSKNPSGFGQSVTFTATVKPAFAGTPAGTVNFKDGTTLLGTATLSGGMASFTTTSLSKKNHSITAVYAGSADYIGSTSPLLSQKVI